MNSAIVTVMSNQLPLAVIVCYFSAIDQILNLRIYSRFTICDIVYFIKRSGIQFPNIKEQISSHSIVLNSTCIIYNLLL